jgi:enoyl-CoA hydratase
MDGTVLLDHRAAVSILTLDCAPFNHISLQLLEEMREAFNMLEERDATRCVVLTGAGTEFFSAGGDVAKLVEFGPGEARNFREAGRAILERMEAFPKPVVAAVRGRCTGPGAALAWVCDIRIASEAAAFNAGDIYGGSCPSWSMGMVRLVHYVGRNRTLDVMLLGEDITATEALRLGLVSRVVPDDQFEAEVARVSNRLATAAPLAVSALKQAVQAQWRDTPDRAAMLEERSTQQILLSRDAQEGKRALMERRQPTFEGR